MQVYHVLVRVGGLMTDVWRLNWIQEKCSLDCTECYDVCSENAVSITCVKHDDGVDKSVTVDMSQCNFCEDCCMCCDNLALYTDMLHFDEDDGCLQYVFHQIKGVD